MHFFISVRFEYGITSEIIDILNGEAYSISKKSIAKDMGFIIGHEGIDAAIKKYFTLKNDKLFFIDETEFNQPGKELNRKEYEIALKMIINYELKQEKNNYCRLIIYSWNSCRSIKHINCS